MAVGDPDGGHHGDRSWLWLVTLLLLLRSPGPPGDVSPGERVLREQVWGAHDAAPAVPAHPGRVP